MEEQLSRSVSVRAAVDAYLQEHPLAEATRVVYRSTLRRFSDHVGPDVPVAVLDAPDVARFLARLEASSAATYNANLVALRSFARWCHTKSLSVRNFAAGIGRRPS